MVWSFLPEYIYEVNPYSVTFVNVTAYTLDSISTIGTAGQNTYCCKTNY